LKSLKLIIQDMKVIYVTFILKMSLILSLFYLNYVYLAK